MTGPPLAICRHCGHQVSSSALYCPACWRYDDSQTNLAISTKKVARWALLIGLAAIGPNAIVGAMLGPSLSRPNQRQVKEIARRTKAIDSIPLGMEMTTFFSATGFTHVMLYDVKRNPEIPEEIPYGNYLRTVFHEPTSLGGTLGTIEYKAPANVRPPRRPKPWERFGLGKEIYESLLEAADDFAKNGPPPVLGRPFHYEGEHHRARAEYLRAKYEEYVEAYG